MKSVEDVVQDHPVINGFSCSIFGVDVGGAPLQGSGAVARSQKIVDANINRDRAKLGDFAEQLLSIRRVCVVGLIVSEVIPNRGKRAVGLIRMNMDGDVVWILFRSSDAAIQHARQRYA